MLSPQFPDLNLVDYEVWGNAEVLSQAAAGAKKQFLSLKMHFS